MKKLLAVLFIATMLLGSVTVSAAVDIVVKANTYTETSNPQSTSYVHGNSTRIGRLPYKAHIWYV